LGLDDRTDQSFQLALSGQGKPDRVLVWARQLERRDLPPICAMSGQPAEVWGRFRFVTAPAWAGALHMLPLILTGVGLVLIVLITAAVSRRAGGWLPLTRSSRRKLRTVFWTFTGLLAGGIAAAFWGLGAIVLAPDMQGRQAAIGLLLLVVGLIAFIIGALGFAAVRPRIGPQGVVTAQWVRGLGNVVELRDVHPVFVLAVHQLQDQHVVAMHHARSQFGRIEVD
jgi:uncharacterized membrane protein